MTIDGIGRATVRTFNSLREPLTIKDPIGVTTTYVYDSAGNIQSESTPLVGSSPAVSKTTSYTYGDVSHPGDVTSITDAAGKVWLRSWATYGNLSSDSDPITHGHDLTTYSYDTLVRKSRVITPRGTAAGITCSTANPTYTTLITTDAFGE